MSIHAIQYHCDECDHIFPSWECREWKEESESRCRACKAVEGEQDIHDCPMCNGAAYAPQLLGSQKDDMIHVLEKMIEYEETGYEDDTGSLWTIFGHELGKTWWFDETKESIQACYLTVLAAPHKRKQMVIGMLENWYLSVPRRNDYHETTYDEYE